ncbi:hypothetical protein AB0H73_00295 [Streptomyces olivoreticuli]
MSTATLRSPRTTTEYESGCTYQLTAPAHPATARVAREFVRAVLLSHDHARLVDNALVCVSDAVAKTHRHAKGPNLSVEVNARTDRVNLYVRDGSLTGAPVPRELRTEDERDPLLTLVRCLSSASGVTWLWNETHRAMTARVWVELRTDAVIG